MNSLKSRNKWAKAARILAKTILYLVLFLLVIALFLNFPFVQRYLRDRVVVYLEKKLDTKVVIGGVQVSLPRGIRLENVYIEDRQKDTLLSGGTITATMNFWRLAFRQEVVINKLELENITAKIKRNLPDTVFNYQFIVDAFMPRDTIQGKDTIVNSEVDIGSLRLDSIRLIYEDVFTGDSLIAWIGHLDSKIDKFDPVKMEFDIPEANLKGFYGRLYQVKPLARPEPMIVDSLEAAAIIPFLLNSEKTTLEDVHFHFENSVSAVFSDFDIGLLNVNPGMIDLAGKKIGLDALELTNSAFTFRLGNKKQAEVVLQQAKQEVQSLLDVGWSIRIGTLDLKNNLLNFDNDNAPHTSNGMDYAHLDLDSFYLKGHNVVINNDTALGTIEAASFEEKKSRFSLEELHTTFLYTATEASLHDLYLRTPGTELKHTAAIRYASPQALIHDIGNMQVDLDLENSKLLVRDLLTFAPQARNVPAFADPNATWYINSKIGGRLADLQIPVLQLEGLQNTRVNIAGSITGLPDIKNFKANLSIHEISTSKRDLQRFIPAGLMPKQITIPERMRLNGSLATSGGELTTDLSLVTDMGNASIKGKVNNLADQRNADYDLNVTTTAFNLGRLLQNPSVDGPVSATFSISGNGFDPATANLHMDGVIQSALINQYNYRNLDFNAQMVNQRVAFNAEIADPNIDLSVNGTADLSGQYPALHVSGKIDSMKLQALHFTTEHMIVRGNLDADLPVADPDNLQGEILLTQALFVQNEKRLNLDTVQMIAGRSDSGQYIHLYSDIANAKLEGQYKLSQIGTILQQSIQPYFAIVPPARFTPAGPYDFTLDAYILDNPALKLFIPGLKRMDSISFRSHFSNNEWSALLDAPVLEMNSGNFQRLHVQAGTSNGNSLLVSGSLGKLQSGKTMELINTSFTASVAGNKIDFVVNNKDIRLRDRYILKGSLVQQHPGEYAISLSPDTLLLNYDTWSVSPNNKLIITKSGIQASNLVLSRSGQQLALNGKYINGASALEANFTNFRLATLTGFIQQDSTFANGLINGQLVVTDFKKPLFTSDLDIRDFTFKGDSVGNIHAIVNSRAAGVYTTDIRLTGHGNDASLTGTYYSDRINDPLDLIFDIRAVSIASLQPFTMGQLTNSNGLMKGKFAVTGSMQSPHIKGDLVFDKASFHFGMLNSYFAIDQQTIKVNEQGIHFNRFQVKDSAGNILMVNGTAATTNFSNYEFDLQVNATNFQALNSTKRDNRNFYGQLYFNTNLMIQGTESAPKVDGRLVVNNKTKMTVVIPQNEPGIVEREGVIEFIDRDAPLNDSLFVTAFDSLNRSSFRGLDIAVNLIVDKEAEFNLVLDEGNGDFINVKGEANLTAGIDPSGQITLSGLYELDQGSYELSFNFIHRKFNIQKGSRILWEGEPTKATVDVHAIYVANTAPLDLVKDQLGETTAFERNTYLQKLPFDVHLNMTGELMKPEITFDIVLPEGKSYIVSGEIITNVRTRLEQLRQEEGEMNKQVFSLLLLNRFITENPFSSSTPGFNAGAFARQSVSKILAEQLNRLAGDLIAGVDINFDVLASEDYTTGVRQDRTDLNVALSKRLLNDRLTVTVGSNFELEGPQSSSNQGDNIAANVAVDYRLSRDNRYMLRVYRKNEYQGVIEGYIIETGVAFIITVDYDKLRELFLSRGERQERRQRRKQQRQERKQQNQTPPTSDSTTVVR